ncbi:MAG TPA: tyrosine--tRNA ligase [Solirubrobacterales bacterium]|jgi:tyrosyl-tRNA synthetase|nr:tyrosine--tRNA ligase [Solirubrobacterales bacterium]
MPDLTRNAVEVLPEGRLAEQLKLDRPLRVKLGIDPTTADIHLGHTVVLSKLAEFQAAGHTVVLIVGDFTARVGDPSGRSASRPVPTPAEIEANATTYQEQAYKILDPARTEVRRNSEWLDMNLAALLRLMGSTTVARLLERDDFQKRMAANAPIAGHELLYPLLQGYDSVAIDADVELGGTDQKFNLLFGRDVQSAYDKPQQSILTLPILVGTDGVQKMSKSLGNYVGVTDAPADMFGKLMSIPDEAMDQYYRLLLGEEGRPDGAPNQAKRELGRRIVDRFHGEGAGKEAEGAFDKVFVQHAVPDDIPEVDLSAYLSDGDREVHLPRLIAGAFGLSSSEGRRLLAGGGVKLDGEPISGITLDVPAELLAGRVLQVGKRRFAKLSNVDWTNA